MQQHSMREFKANMSEGRLKTKAELMKDMASISLNSQQDAKSIYAPFEVWAPLNFITIAYNLYLTHRRTRGTLSVVRYRSPQLKVFSKSLFPHHRYSLI